MQYNEFGKMKKMVSRFGLGCMRLPQMKNAEGKDIIDENESIKIIRHAVDNGVNYLDTAYTYPGSEEVLGKALKDGYREKC
jgi:predicted aldo/keto reductase-like oxidoreductase